MKSIVANDDLKDFLRQAETLVEIRDASGAVIGFFAPVALEHADRYAEAAAAIDPMAGKRPARTGPVMTTVEVLTHLQNLGTR